MTKQISRRDFLKLAGAGAVGATALTGCGPASRYVKREQYTSMPEYQFNGESVFYATTCRECAAGCGLIVRTFQGRALKTEGNPNNPVNLGKTCARGQATLQGLYNPDRVTQPIKNVRGAVSSSAFITWDDALAALADALKNTNPSEIGFLLGLAPDHVFDFFAQFAQAIGSPAPIRYSALSLFEARSTLRSAARNVLGKDAVPFFDLSHADVVFSFGANFLETWLSPVAYTRGFAQMRRGHEGHRGTMIHFEPRMSQTAAVADEWVAIKPGTEGSVALAIGKLAAEKLGKAIAAFDAVDVVDAALRSGVSMAKLEELAEIFAHANSAVAIPGGSALGMSNGMQTAEAVIALNGLSLTANVTFTPDAPVSGADDRSASLAQMADFIQKLKDGKIKTLFVHGVNPAFELPKSFGFADAIKDAQVFSFATFPDETAKLADYVLPDHHGLESWGYQRAIVANRVTISGAQPVVVPMVDSRATIDVMLAASAQAGVGALKFKDEVEFIQNQVASLVGQGGAFNAGDPANFFVLFQQYGGWWQTNAALEPARISAGSIQPAEAEYAGAGEFYLMPFLSPTMAEAGANKPWLQELPDSTTTVMWNTWVEINPATAEEMGLENDDVVKITSAYGEIEASVYKYPAIRPDTIAIPFGQGHTAYGRFAEGRGANPADLLGAVFNAAGDLAFAGMKVNIVKTGKTKELSRMESKMGVYGEDMGHE
jgi:anaerobic selenocysteine-containing dehydrogenase